MSVARTTAACLACALTASASATITDLSAWDFYRDPDPGPGALQDAMTGSAAANLAQLNFINDVDVPAAYDIGFSSVNANTVAEATSGYYFNASQDFTVEVSFSITTTSPQGFNAIGFGIGEDRAGVNSAGVVFGMWEADGPDGTVLSGAATNDDTPNAKLIRTSAGILPTDTSGFTATFEGTMTVEYVAASGDITVYALGPSFPFTAVFSATYDGASELDQWAGEDLLVSFFLRSDSIPNPPAGLTGPWTGESAQADFFDFTVVQGTPIAVPEPASIATLWLGLGLLACRRR